MSQQRMFRLDPITAIFALLMVFVAIYFVLKGVTWLLSWAMPVLLVLTLIINYRVVLNYIKMLGRLLKNNTLWGIGAVILTFLFSPFVVAFLFAKALLNRKVEKMMHQAEAAQEERDGEYISFEDISIPDEKQSLIELPPLREKHKRDNNDYEDLFK